MLKLSKQGTGQEGFAGPSYEIPNIIEPNDRPPPSAGAGLPGRPRLATGPLWQGRLPSGFLAITVNRRIHIAPVDHIHPRSYGLIMKGMRIAWMFSLVSSLTLFFSGCARYQFVLVEPSEHRQTITKEGSVLPMSPVDYGIAADGSRLSLRVMNRSTDPIRLVGDRSYLVDPTGATHPLPGGTVAPNAHIGLFFPPAPVVYRSSPRFSFGFGFGHYHSPYHGLHTGWAYEPWLYGPTDFYAVNPAHHWEWKTGEIRMQLFYESGQTNFQHNFTFDRRKVE